MRRNAVRGGDVLDALITAVAELDAWSTLLPLTSAMSHDSLRLFAERPTVHTDTVLTALTPDTPDTAWQALIQVRDDIPARLQTRLAERARELGRDDDADDLAPLRTTAN
ncbi:hypothetical protein ACFXPS_05455 [Nocardia sp. NPDC059091]|uniref:hypothetical protein n=1 Tax=Nocardia sp. NPDC059091 TaxID=3346724 RepID=UPI003684E8D2